LSGVFEGAIHGYSIDSKLERDWRYRKNYYFYITVNGRQETSRAEDSTLSRRSTVAPAAKSTSATSFLLYLAAQSKGDWPL